jgi:tRNA(Ile)-lysidine synthase
MLTSQDRLLVGVSGGADSTALLLALRELEYNVAVAHLNHGLRGSDSDEDASFVKALAEQLRVPFFTQTVQIPQNAGNIEAEGRAARRGFFQSLMRAHGFTKVAVAHNREDRVETFLLHLMRGAGTDGLVSMAPVAGSTVRPLIETPRLEIEAYLQNRHQPWRTDGTNQDISFARNRMRHEVMPRLASLFNVQLVEALSRTVNLLQDEHEWMQSLAAAWMDSHRDGQGLDTELLRELPAGLCRRIIRESLREKRDLTEVTFDHIESVRGLLQEGKSGKVIQLPGGVAVAREFNRLVFTRTPREQDVIDFSYDLPIPGVVEIPQLGRAFRAEVVELSEPPLGMPETRVFVDGSDLGACVKIRNWKPGDYYRPAGWPAGKVKKLFQRARIPRSQRGRWPIFSKESTIIWVTSFPVSREFVPGPSSKKIVAFEALER